MKATLTAILLCLALAVAGCGDDDSSATDGATTDTTTQADAAAPAESPAEAAKRKKPKVTVAQGAPPQKLVKKDLIEGSGPPAKAGDEVTVQYVGAGFETGEEFDASWDRGEPFSFSLGAGEVIPGWDQGIEGMKAGGQRELTIPANLAYGSAGAPPAIGPDEALVFVVDLLKVN
jgi:peptidylprolyl isomerase